MDQPQAKPLRSRRRWLIGMFVLVLLSLVAWWYWPRGDARFVGKWHIIEQPGPVLSTYHLRSSGLGTFIQTASGVSRRFPMRWWTNDDLIFFEIWSGDLKDDLGTLMDRLTGRLRRAPFRIVEVDPAFFRLQQNNGDSWTWERLSE